MAKQKLHISPVVYPGSFDPLTFGHIDIIRRAKKLFGKVIVAVGSPSSKNFLFTIEERVEIIKNFFKNEKDIEVEKIDGLLVDFVKKKNAKAIIRGIRAVSDFEYEFQMAWMNRKLYPEIEVVFLLPSEKYAYLSSTLVKEIALLKGDLTGLVPEFIIEKIKEKIG
ncbi:MAG: pantetheine-phosphate adenylyltransferase [candidate division WOR-3 bacterium]